MIVNSNGGTTALNFRFVNGTSAPSNPVENTFWIKTSTAINGWFFGPDQPSPASAGMVWVKTGTSSVPFNALKKNAVWIYPEAVYQYVSSKWAEVEASVYQGSQWVDIIGGGGGGGTAIVLYEAGNQHSDLTGGWSGSGWSDYANSYTENSATITTSGIVIKTSGTGNRACVCGTNNKVSFGKNKNIAVTVSNFQNPFLIGISPGKQFWDDEGYTPMLALAYIMGDGITNLEIPAGVTSGYVVVYSFADGSMSFGTVTKVEMM